MENWNNYWKILDVNIGKQIFIIVNYTFFIIFKILENWSKYYKIFGSKYWKVKIHNIWLCVFYNIGNIGRNCWTIKVHNIHLCAFCFILKNNLIRQNWLLKNINIGPPLHCLDRDLEVLEFRCTTLSTITFFCFLARIRYKHMNTNRGKKIARHRLFYQNQTNLKDATKMLFSLFWCLSLP